MRVHVLNRDGFTCQQCGLRPDDGAVLHAAHIRPLSRGGGREIANMVTLCANCHAQYDREYVADSIRQTPHTFDALLNALASVAELNAAQLPRESLQAPLRNLLFASAIAAFETYLSDTVVGAVTREPLLVRRALRSVPELRSRKLELHEIFERMDALQTEVRDYLLDLVYHNLGKIKPLFHSVLGVEFPRDMSDMIRAIHRRHDIVHRNGKTKDGQAIVTTQAEVDELVTRVTDFARHLEDQVVRRPWDD